MSWTLPFAGLGLVVADNPDDRCDAGVVEHIGGQADDGFDQVVLQHVAADFALARAGAAGEQRRAVQDDAEAAAADPCRRAHLGDEMQQKQQRAVADARQAGAEAAVEALLLVLACGFPSRSSSTPRRTADWRACSRSSCREAVVGERVAEEDVVDVLALDEHVGLADGVGLGVEFLAVHDAAGRRGCRP